MLFHLVCFLAFMAIGAAVVFGITRRKLSTTWRSAGPKPIADALKSRNRTFLLVVVGLLVVLAFFEAVAPRLAYAVQDLQSDTLQESLPGWALVTVGNGSISWLFYLAILAGIFAGLVGGTLAALRADGDLSRVGARDVI